MHQNGSFNFPSTICSLIGPRFIFFHIFLISYMSDYVTEIIVYAVDSCVQFNLWNLKKKCPYFNFNSVYFGVQDLAVTGTHAHTHTHKRLQRMSGYSNYSEISTQPFSPRFGRHGPSFRIGSMVWVWLLPLRHFNEPAEIFAELISLSFWPSHWHAAN